MTSIAVFVRLLIKSLLIFIVVIMILLLILQLKPVFNLLMSFKPDGWLFLCWIFSLLIHAVIKSFSCILSLLIAQSGRFALIVKDIYIWIIGPLFGYLIADKLKNGYGLGVESIWLQYFLHPSFSQKLTGMIFMFTLYGYCCF